MDAIGKTLGKTVVKTVVRSPDLGLELKRRGAQKESDGHRSSCFLSHGSCYGSHVRELS